MTHSMLRQAGIALLGIPVVALLVLTVAEVAGGDITGLQHLVEVMPLVLLAVLGWRWPYRVGLLLMLAGAVLAVVFVYWHPEGTSLASIGVVEAVLFLPAIVAGALLTLAGALSRGGSPASSC